MGILKNNSDVRFLVERRPDKRHSINRTFYKHPNVILYTIVLFVKVNFMVDLFSNFLSFPFKNFVERQVFMSNKKDNKQTVLPIDIIKIERELAPILKILTK